MCKIGSYSVPSVFKIIIRMQSMDKENELDILVQGPKYIEYVELPK